MAGVFLFDTLKKLMLFFGRAGAGTFPVKPHLRLRRRAFRSIPITIGTRLRKLRRCGLCTSHERSELPKESFTRVEGSSRLLEGPHPIAKIFTAGFHLHLILCHHLKSTIL